MDVIESTIQPTKSSSMIPLVVMALFSFLLALTLGATETLAPAAAMHVAFAMGVVPMIFGAMLHFIPVLTRSETPGKAILALPFIVQLFGVAVVGAMQGWLPRWSLHAVAVANGILAAALWIWVADRARNCVGRAHPGWIWYSGSLAVIVLAMIAVPFMDSEFGRAARLFHMHLNTLGFVGLAALGTLPVLMPTVIGVPELQAAWWLHRWFPPMLLGALLLAAGAALYPPVSLLALPLILAGLTVLARRWLTVFGWSAIRRDGAAASLGVALIGLAVLLLVGAVHGLGYLPARPAIAGFVACFLLPLVSGALSQLLPIWRHPGPNSPQREALRRRLVAGGQLRSLLFVVGGLAFLAGFALPGLLITCCGILVTAFAPFFSTR